jgi:recombination protein RecA
MNTASARLDSPVLARAAVESLLRARRLDRTLTSSRPAAAPDPGVPFDVQPLDTYLQGGLPAGQLSEVVGPGSSGRTTVVWRWLAAATRRGDTVALIDTFDRFDPESAAAAGIDLDRLLWVRGQAISKTGGAVDPVWLPGVRTVDGPGTMVERTVDRALKALNLVLQSGVCPVVVIDMADVPATALRRIPYTTWLRVQRVIDGSDTTCVLVAPEPMARSAGGVTLTMQTPGRGVPVAVAGPDRAPLADGAVTTHVAWRGQGARARRFDGLRFDARVSSSRRQAAGRVSLAAEPRADRRWAER